MDDIFLTMGDWLANLYIGYGLFFLAFGATFCVHLAALVFLAWPRDPLRFRWLVRTIEVLYGLLNPMVYLLFLEQMMELDWHAGLRGLGWTGLLAFWMVRLWGGLARARASRFGRRVARLVLWAAVACVVAFLVKDLATTLPKWPRPGGSWGTWWLGALFLLNTFALYAIPVVAALRLLRLAAREETWRGGEGFYLLSPRLALASGALAVLTVVLFHLPATERTAERRVLAHRAAILDAADRFQLDPRLIAAILHVITQEHSAPLARQLERVAMGVWLQDAGNQMGLGQRLDLSIGIAQIRPTTALTALTIYEAAGIPAAPDGSLVGSVLDKLHTGGVYKDLRGIPDLDATWRLPASAVADLRPTFSELPSKREMVAQLFDDGHNVEMCGLILALYAIQWENANPGWSLRERPEILATLYQRGFERSQPKPNPRPNAFGERVREVYASAWMREKFGDASGPRR